MRPQQLWTGAIGVALVCVGIAIVGTVAYLLYTPERSHPEAQGAVVYSCPGMTIVSFFSESQVRLTFANGRIVDAVRVPAGVIEGGEGWTWYISQDGNSAFRIVGDRAFFEERGEVLYGECRESKNK